jgi:hypothetical protein
MAYYSRICLGLFTAISLAAPPAHAQNRANDWQRQQQQQQLERQRQQEAARQREQDRQREQERQRQRDQERARLQDQERQRARETERQRQLEQQRQQAANDNRQKSRAAAQTGQQSSNRTNASGASSIVARSNDRVVYANGVARLTRPLTAAEIRRGFTGKLTADGRALVKFQNRVFAVPAARVGIKTRPRTRPAATVLSWSAARRTAIANDIRALATARGSSGGGGRPPAGPANDNSMSANRMAFARFVRGANVPLDKVLSYGKGWNFAKPVRITTLKAGTELCRWQAPGQKHGTHFSVCGSRPTRLGVADTVKVTDPDGTTRIVERAETRFTLTQDVEVLEGTAAAIDDDFSHDSWHSDRGRVPTVGGDRQYMIRYDDLSRVKEMR